MAQILKNYLCNHLVTLTVTNAAKFERVQTGYLNYHLQRPLVDRFNLWFKIFSLTNALKYFFSFFFYLCNCN